MGYGCRLRQFARMGKSMRSPIRSPICSPIRSALEVGGSAPWTYARLFASGEQGIAVPDLTAGNGALFQDSGGTTPVSAYGQPVGRANDLSGGGRHLIQATSAARPTLDSAGVLNFDGIDDSLSVVVGNIGANCTMIVGNAGGLWYQEGTRYTEAGSVFSVPQSQSLRCVYLVNRVLTAPELQSLATYHGYASATKVQMMLAAGTYTNPTLAISTVGAVQWSAYWEGGSLLAQGSSDTERTLTQTNLRGLVCIIAAGEVTRMVSTACKWTSTLEQLPGGLTSFVCTGSNACSGSVASLPSGITTFICYGNNTCSGSVANLPSGLIYFECGNNTCSGSVEQLPSGLTTFLCAGNNTCSGSVANLPSGLTYFYCGGNNTCSGSVSNLPSGLATFACFGYNTCSGSVAALPSGLTTFICTGNNTCSCDGATWYRANMSVFRLGGTKSTATVDAIFNAMAATITSAIGSKLIDLQETGVAAPSSASAAARAYLAGLTYTVQTN